MVRALIVVMVYFLTAFIIKETAGISILGMRGDGVMVALVLFMADLIVQRFME